MKTYTLKEAAERCGYKRVNTIREMHLSSPEDRQLLGYDIRDGRVHLNAAAIDRLGNELGEQRQARGNWRVKNLGAWAEPRDGRRPRQKRKKTDV